MKANELRIGNWVSNGGCLAKVAYLLSNEINCDRPDFEGILNGKITGIPLTEEWLLKFGFVKEKGSYIMGVHQNRFSGLMKFKFDPLIQWVFSVGKYKDITRVKFVHELQNLYFALTGEELEINN